MNMPDKWGVSQTVELWNPTEPPKIWSNALAVAGDNEAHKWTVTLLYKGQPASLTGSVSAEFIRKNNTRVPAEGTLVGNVASVVVPQEALLVDGAVLGVMRLVDGDVTMTLAEAVIANRDLLTGDVVDPGELIPNLDQLLAKIHDCETAAAAALSAASAASVWVTKENLFSLVKSVAGYLTDSGAVASPGGVTQERTSDYIPVTPGDAMAYQCWVNVPAGSIPWAAYCFYDSGRAKTGSVVAVTDATSTASDGSKYIAQTFTVPNGAAYIRVSFRTFGAARAKLEVGSTPTLYVVNKHDYLALQQINARTMRVDGTTLIFTEPTEE
jgi:hypothetical protein